ncbi:MAG: hypothetical protein U9M89_01305 [Patescibacteria group bacterium]|nr:hypothetical protein [Patescibacteria group bacterium]
MNNKTHKGFRLDDSRYSAFFDGLLYLILFVTAGMWFYAFLSFPASKDTSIMYVGLCLFSAILLNTDRIHKVTKDTILADIPVDMIGFENFKWKHLIGGALLGFLFALLSLMNSGPLHAILGVESGNILFTGVPAAAVNSFQDLPSIWKALYIGSVALPENQALCIVVAATFTAYAMTMFGGKDKHGTLYQVFSVVGSVIAALISMAYHSMVYANQLNTLIGVGIFFFIGALLSMQYRDASIFFSSHLVYNSGIVAMSIVPMAIGGGF